MQHLIVKARINFHQNNVKKSKLFTFNKKIKNVIDLNLKSNNSLSIILSNYDMSINNLYEDNNIIYANYNKIKNKEENLCEEIYTDIQYAAFDYPHKYINLVVYNYNDYDFYEDKEKVYLIKEPNTLYIDL
jgi:hypothetical protein